MKNINHKGAINLLFVVDASYFVMIQVTSC